MKRAIRLLPTAALAAAALGSLSCDDQSSTTRAINANPAIGDFVVYAQRKVKLGDHNSVGGGDVGVARPAPSDIGPQLVVQRRSLVDPNHSLIAPSIKLENRARVGDVQTDSLDNQGAMVGTVAGFPAGMPALPQVADAGPGGEDVFVRQRDEESLTPGDYGDLKVFGTLVLDPGLYTFTSVTLGDHGQLLVADGEADVHVSGRLETGKHASLGGPADHSRPRPPCRHNHQRRHGQGHGHHRHHHHGPPPPAATGALTINVAGSDGAHGGFAASLGDDTTVKALLAAARGTLKLGDGVHATGAFAAFDVKAGDRCKFVFERGFTPTPGTQPITSYAPPPAAPVIASVPANQVISLAVGLPVRSLPALQAFVKQVSDPTNASYRQYLSQADLQTIYLPTDADYASLVAWAQGENLQVVSHANKLAVDLSGTAARIEQAFHANLIIARRPDGTTFYRLDGPPSVDLQTQLLGASGLDNFIRPRPVNHTNPLGADESEDFRGAYLGAAGSPCAALDGAGQSIGIFSYTGFVNQDILDYQTNTGLVNVPAVQVETSNDPNGLSPTAAPPLAPTGNLENWEISLDIEMAQAMAPAAQVIVFEGRNGDSMLANMSNHATVGSFSMSWLDGTSAITQTILDVMAAQGQSYVMGSGDWGAYQPSTVMCPPVMGVVETQPFGDHRTMNGVTVIGGTVLTTAAGLWTGEVTWSTSGGGILEGITIPTYQVGLNAANPEVSTTSRNLPDVALTATNLYIVTSNCNGVDSPGATGAPVPGAMPPMTIAACPPAQVTSGIQRVVGGVSGSGPLWAGLIALMNQQAEAAGLARVGFLNPAVYQIGNDPMRYANAFHDIGAGGGETAPNLCGTTYNSQVGYDLTTGWGTPTCGLFNDINKRPANTPSVVVVATEGQQGVRFCIQGLGWPPGAAIAFKFLDLPNNQGQVNSIETAPVGSDGMFTSYNSTFGGGASSIRGHIQFCDAMDLTESMTVEAHDQNNPALSATTMILNTWVCGAMPTQNNSNLTPLVYPVLNVTDCPLPID